MTARPALSEPVHEVVWPLGRSHWDTRAPAVLRTSAAVERAGYPTVSIVSTGFLKQAEVVARGLGLPDMPIAHYPGVPMTDSVEQLQSKVENELMPLLVKGITAHDVARLTQAEPVVGRPAEHCAESMLRLRSADCNAG